MLQKWLQLAPAALPQNTEYLAPVLMHPDLHGGNLLVNHIPTEASFPYISSDEEVAVRDAESGDVSITGVIDWQGAAIRPFFEIAAPACVEVTERGLQYVKLEEGSRLPVLPDLETLDGFQKFRLREEITRVDSMRQYLAYIGPSRQAVLNSMRSPYLELLRHTIYYSCHSWSDGLPNLERVLVRLCEAYEDGSIPGHRDYPNSPVQFSPSEQEARDKDFHRTVGLEAQLEEIVHTRIRRAGITLHPDGSVQTEELEIAVQLAQQIFVALTRIDDPGVLETTTRLWPLREGKFVLSSESCND